MKQITYTHPADSKGPIYRHTMYGVQLVQPGQTIVEREVPDGDASLIDAGVADSKLSDLQKLSIAKIETELPSLTADELKALLTLEQDAKVTRASLVTKLEEAIVAKKIATEGQGSGEPPAE